MELKMFVPKFWNIEVKYMLEVYIESFIKLCINFLRLITSIKIKYHCLKIKKE